MTATLQNLWRAMGRVWPACVTQSQAAAFNMFLSFFPMLLLVFGVVGSFESLKNGVQEMVLRMGPLLPPGTVAIVRDFLTKHPGHAGTWISLGLGGTLIAGTQMMRVFIEGFHITQRIERPPLFEQIWRAILLLVVTLVPTVIAIVIVVFGKQMRITMTERFGFPVLIRVSWAILLTIAALLLAMFVLTLVYRLGTRGVHSWSQVVPGAVIATPLWWTVSWIFGAYMRHVPYDAIYGALATAIGLMIWMNLTAIIILLGSAYNAVYCQRARSASAVIPQQVFAR